MVQEPKIDDRSASPTPTAGSSQSQAPIIPVMLSRNTTAEITESNNGAGLYAVACPSMGMGSMAMFPPSTLIPLKYTVPTRQASSGGVGGEQGQDIRQQHGPQRQVAIRRFRFGIHQIDLALIIKLAAMVFLLSQDGSEQKLILLIFFATLVYLYQTGVLTPFIQWFQRVGAPPPRQPLVPPQNDPLVAQVERNNGQPENNSEADNQNQPENNEAVQAANDNQLEPRRQGANWWGVVKEIQLFVVGFITSLFPGPHNND